MFLSPWLNIFGEEPPIIEPVVSANVSAFSAEEQATIIAKLRKEYMGRLIETIRSIGMFRAVVRPQLFCI